MFISDIEFKIWRVIEICFDLKIEQKMLDERKWEYIYVKMLFL